MGNSDHGTSYMRVGGDDGKVIWRTGSVRAVGRAPPCLKVWVVGCKVKGVWCGG
jgi:hypothetical protein